MVEKQDLHRMMGDDKSWQTVWCGENLRGQDVSIHLVTAETEHHQGETLAELKVHSSHLKKCSKYFEACLSERWTKPPSSKPNSLEFVLEVHGENNITCYVDCFSRMYTPFLKDFKDATYSLELLKVASQIEFHQLMSSICGYLSTILWSVGNEMKIRKYSSSPDFPRNYAKDLVARLELGGTKEDYHKQLCNMIEQIICTALRHEGNFLWARGLVEELLQGIGQSVSCNFEKNMVMIINKEAKDLIVNFHEGCKGKGIREVHGFTAKLWTICWVLKTLVRAQVAEEVVGCFLQLDLFPKILLNAVDYDSNTKIVAVDFVKLIFFIYQEVVIGNLLLGIRDRVALLENWLFLFKMVSFGENHEKATEDLLLTLPFKQQMELFMKLPDVNCNACISTSSLIMLLKSTKWPAEDAEQ